MTPIFILRGVNDGGKEGLWERSFAHLEKTAFLKITRRLFHFFTG
jgi:hypothetical protein